MIGIKQQLSQIWRIYIYMKVMTFYIVGYLLELDIESNNSPIKTFPLGD